MSDRNIELTRRKVLGGLASIGATSAAAGAGTMALFSDTESSSGNSVQAGTIDLTGGSDSAFASVSVGGSSGVQPGDKGYIVWDLVNDGSLQADVDVNIGSVAGDGTFSPSLASDTEGTPSGVSTSGSETDTSGSDLDETMTVGAHLDAAGLSEGHTSGSDPSLSGSEDTFVTTGTTLANALAEYDTSTTLSSGGSTQLVLEYEIPTSAGNWIQGDGVTFDVQVELNQQESQ